MVGKGQSANKAIVHAALVEAAQRVFYRFSFHESPLAKRRGLRQDHAGFQTVMAGYQVFLL